MKICPKCGNSHDKAGIFCSYHCSNSKTFSDDTKRKKSIANSNYYASLTPEERKERAIKATHPQSEESKRKIGIKSSIRMKKDPTLILKLSTASSSAHTKLELIALPYIENRFNTTNLLPNKIGKYWFDFVNDFYIIEYTTDNTTGITNAINRFETIIDDKRLKYLVAPEYSFGPVRRKRLYDTGTKFVPIWFAIN